MSDSQNQQYVSKFVLIFLLCLLAVGWFQRYAIYDWFRLRGYQAPPVVAQLASDTTMNEGTRRLFYVYRPQLDAKDAFNANCTDSEQTIILGCYISQRGIYLYDVTDERLRGVEEVTAAHEVLHAAYDRLSSKERKRVDAMTAKAFAAISDERILATIENYRKKDSTIVPNELHSILATEVKDLPADLEAYYRQYFNDRQKVVSYSNAYENEFTKRQALAGQYLSQLDALKIQIDTLNAQLKDQAEDLNAQYAALVRDRNSAQPQEYNARVERYNAAVNDYNAQVRSVSSMIDEYNQILVKYNALALEQNELLKAIDSRPGTLDTQ